MLKGPLSHLTVIDASRVRAGPTAVRLLADCGARVIKVEIPEGAPGGDDMIGAREHDRPDFENLHRNKQGITLNLKEKEALEILHKLIAKADVFIENFRPDVKYKLGIDYEVLKKTTPSLVYASISGFGQSGPYVNRPGFDSIAQGMGGLMSVTGKPGEGPMRVGIPLADLCAGHFCSQAILVALLEREKSGLGQWVSTSLIEAQIAMLDFQAAQWLLAGKVPVQNGNEHPLTVPTGVFKTYDGYINLAAIGQNMWRRLCQALEIPEYAQKEGFDSDPARVNNREAVNKVVGDAFLKKTSAQWTDILNEFGVPCGPIYTIDNVFEDEQVKHLEICWPIEHPIMGKKNLVGPPMHFSRYERPKNPIRSPEKGEHTNEILKELGYQDEQIANLKQKLVV